MAGGGGGEEGEEWKAEESRNAERRTEVEGKENRAKAGGRARAGNQHQLVQRKRRAGERPQPADAAAGGSAKAN